jgi:hypothetical protein
MSYNIKQSLYRLRQALGLQDVEVPAIYRQSGHEGRKVVSPTHRPPLLPIFPVLISVRGSVDARPMTPREIEPATTQLVAQSLSQLRHRVHTHAHTHNYKVTCVCETILY